MFAQNSKTSQGCDVFRNKKLRKSKGISPRQQKAIDLALRGKTQKEIAIAVERSREVVNRWFNQEPNVIAAFELQKQQLITEVLGQDRPLMQAIEVIEAALKRKGELKKIEVISAVELVKIKLVRKVLQPYTVEEMEVNNLPHTSNNRVEPFQRLA